MPKSTPSRPRVLAAAVLGTSFVVALAGPSGMATAGTSSLPGELAPPPNDGRNGRDGRDDWGDRRGIRPPEAIPDHGALPPMVDPDLARSVALKARAARFGPAPAALRALARRHFGNQRVPEVRRKGLDLLTTHADAGALFAMPFTLAKEADDVRVAIIEHLVDSGSDGQAALAWTAIHHEDEAWRRAATDAITRPASAKVLAVMQLGLRDSAHETVVRAGRLAGALDARIAIPHLIATQYAADEVKNEGDLAWIAIGTQRSYVANLIPVTGDGSGAFQPVPGIINEGFVMRVMDAVAIVYRTEIHRVLVDMTSEATGTDTGDNGWSLAAWRDWYNREYLPRAREESDRAARAAAADAFAEAERRRREREASDRLD